MKEAALQQAASRLSRAKNALLKMEQASRFSELDEAWSDFLVASKLVFTKLGAGTKGDMISEAWFGRKLSEQRRDALLAYLYQARNAEEHGLSRSLEHAYDVRVVPGVRLEVEVIPQPTGDMIFRRVDDPEAIVHFPLKGMLGPVVDGRSGRTYGPPLEHKGLPLKDTSVFGVADATIAYLETLLDEAAQLPQRK